MGNICRSPTAVTLLRHHLPTRGEGIESAGLAALTDQPIDPLAGAVLVEHGMDASSHRARQLTRELLKDSDLVLTMEKGQLAEVCRVAPEATGKTFLLDKWVGSRDIPDPYGRNRDAFEKIYSMIEQSVRAWVPYLQ